MKEERETKPASDKTELNTAGAELFTSRVAFRGWLQTKAEWAGGLTPNQLISAGKTDEVIQALRGLANGNVL